MFLHEFAFFTNEFYLNFLTKGCLYCTWIIFVGRDVVLYMKIEDLQKKSKEGLKTIAEMMGVDIRGAKTKADIIAHIAAVAAVPENFNDEKKNKPSDKKEAVDDGAAGAAKASRSKTSKTKSAERRSSGKGKKDKELPSEKSKTKGTDGTLRKNTERKGSRKPSVKKAPDVLMSEASGVDENNAYSEAPDSVKESGNLVVSGEQDISLEKTADLAVENVSEAEAVSEAASLEESTEAETSQKRSDGRTAGDAYGILEIMPDGYGFLRAENFCSGPKDVYVPPVMIKRFSLRNGDAIRGKTKFQKDQSVSQALIYINEINGKTMDQLGRRVHFDQLVPIYPDSRLVLESGADELSTRIIDMVAPIGKGQRGMIVSPPKAGKTVLMKKIANSISENYPDIELIVLLIDERPEEVTDMRESVKGTVVSSTFDELPERHIKVSELVLERAQRLVEQGRDVVILMDSLTRLARAYNLTIPPTGRSLSGGLDPGALHRPKKFFGAARNIRGGGSLTIVATALVDTGSRLDDVIFEEFKGTGNMELHLDRKLSEKRIFPAIDISKSGTRKEELLLSETELNAIYTLRKVISNIGVADATEMIVDKLSKSRDNEAFIASLKIDSQKG